MDKPYYYNICVLCIVAYQMNEKCTDEVQQNYCVVKVKMYYN